MSVGPNSSPNEQHLGRPGDATQQLSGTTLYRWLVAAYGFEGLGYIVSGTFLVAAVVSWPGLESYGALSWVLVGLAAAPSTMIWGLLANRFGEPRALLAAYLLQVAGIVMPVVFLHWSTVFLGAVLFGGTFMGIVTLSMNAGRNLAPHNGRVVGQLTAAYGLGQMIGPMAAGAMATWTGGYEIPLMFAGCLVLAGAGALIPLMIRRYERSVNLSSQ
jgi:predicted MFS family arabinose efflux permease